MEHNPTPTDNNSDEKENPVLPTHTATVAADGTLETPEEVVKNNETIRLLAKDTRPEAVEVLEKIIKERIASIGKEDTSITETKKK